MRKILTGKQIKEVDTLTIKRGEIASHELMESAAKAFVKIFCKRYDDRNPIVVFCGPGNNGGDGMAISRLLLKKNYNVATFYIHASQYSADFSLNLERLIKAGGIVKVINEVPQSTSFKKNTVIIDALFGTGLNKPISGFAASLIEWINAREAVRVAVDIPSGMTDTVPFANSAIIKSDLTVTFQVPKLSLLLEDNSEYVNEFEIADIGLNEKAIASQNSNTFFVEAEDIVNRLPKVKRFDNKWRNGHALLIAGSYEKTGAAILSASSCMRCGVGLLTVHTPRASKNAFNITLPEAIIQPDAHENIITSIDFNGKYNAAGIGPGIGTNELTGQALESFLRNWKKPLVLDADALNIMGSKKELLNLLTEKCILTPHAKEFDRLTHEHNTHYERIETQRKFSQKYKCVVVLKSAYTTISDMEGNIFFNSTGNGGMAKAGSGDVLTGIALAFAAKEKEYDIFDAALCAVFVHGMAGDEAIKKTGKISMKAGDIIRYLPRALKTLTE